MWNDVLACWKLNGVFSQQTSQKWETTTIQDIVMACIILHNMITENEKEDMLPPIEVGQEVSIIQTHNQHALTLQEYRHGSTEITMFQCSYNYDMTL
jgi:Tfp pilus assembly pilus retraction ATPase PilT